MIHVNLKSVWTMAIPCQHTDVSRGMGHVIYGL